jgi:hypothetical protein
MPAKVVGSKEREAQEICQIQKARVGAFEDSLSAMKARALSMVATTSGAPAHAPILGPAVLIGIES